ncbi:hypothetical protein JI435_419750, partial [Parastagonospora nodorum SN15]
KVKPRMSKCTADVSFLQLLKHRRRFPLQTFSTALGIGADRKPWKHHLNYIQYAVTTGISRMCDSQMGTCCDVRVALRFPLVLLQKGWYLH